jgi:hypothetical protein
MPVEYKKNRAIFHNDVSVEEAEGLLEWLQNNPAACADLSACSHLHTACLQVMMAAHANIVQSPHSAELRAWLEPALTSEE